MGGLSSGWTDSLRLADRVLRGLARGAISTFYRKIQVLDAERIPATGPLIFVGNHGNGLIDPALAMGYLPPTVRFLGKATLWKHPVVGPFMRLAGAIPIQRPNDPGANMARNQDSFQAASEHLENGGALCIFPEGMSHDEPSLLRMKTGTARIALDAASSNENLGLKVVPFGLAFSARDRFRSRVGIVIGEPILVSADGVEPTWDQVEELTRRIEKGLSAVTLNYESWRERRLVHRAVDLFYREPGRSDARPIADRLDSYRRFVEAYRTLRADHPEITTATAEAVLDYDHLLKLVGLTDRQILEPVPLRRLVSLAARSLFYLVIALPAAAVGFVLHALPWFLSRGLPRWTKQPLHQRATYAVMSGVVLVPTIWIGITVWAVRAWGWKGCWLLLLAPASGWVALRVAETTHRLWHTTRGLATMHLGRRTQQLLTERRREAQVAVARMVEIYTDPENQLPSADPANAMPSG